MTKIKNSILPALIFIIIVSNSHASDKIKIMPVGNSITAGEHYGFPALEERTGYRKVLYEMLVKNGYKVNFVGSQKHGIRDENDKDWFDWNCEAYPGWKIPDIAKKVDTALTLYKPDILLLHVGTNGKDWDAKPAQVMDMLDMINQYSLKNNHPIIVFLSLIINRFKDEDPTYTTMFNNSVAKMVNSRTEDKIKIILVDMENGAGLDYSDDLPDSSANPFYEGGDMLGYRYPGVSYDKYHPNDKGNAKMAVKFYNELVKVLVPEAPWQLNGKLEISKNGHFIQHKNGKPFLWIGDTGWGMMQQLTREEVNQYLDNRKSLGFTVIQSVAHWSPHGGGMKRDYDNAPNAYGFKPFTGEEHSPNTSEPLVVEGGTSEIPNDYWDNVNYVIDAVKKRNMYLALLPCWAAQFITGTGEYNIEEAKSYGEFLGKRYGQEPNIIWVLGGDTKAEFNGYDKHQKFSEYDNRNIFRAMAEGIVSGATGKNPSWNETNAAWDELFFTYHPNGDYPYGSAQWFHQDVWLDANGVEVWKEVDDVYRAMLDNYQLNNPVKPCLFLEGSYEYGTYRHECGWVTPVRVRRQLYQTFFAGGAGHTYGAGPVWAMRGNEGDYNCGYTWQQALDFPGAAQVAEIGKKFLIDHNWYEWIPNGNIISGAGQGESLKTAVAAASGDMTLVYFSNNSHTRVKNILDTEAEAFWFYPRNGQIVKVDNIKKNESRVMVPPQKWEDAILVFRSMQ